MKTVAGILQNGSLSLAKRKSLRSAVSVSNTPGGISGFLGVFSNGVVTDTVGNAKKPILQKMDGS